MQTTIGAGAGRDPGGVPEESTRGRALFDLDGRVALVTGSSRGIGLALASGLAEAGATVVLNGLGADRLEASRRRLADRFGEDRVHAAAFDVTSPEEVRRGVAWIEDSVGPLRILVNNAGIQHRVPLLDLATEDWDRVIAADLTSAFLVGREAALRMVPRGAGKIINVCSVQSDLARPGIAPYTAAKGGLRNLTRAMTAEWAGRGLQVNGLAPGYIDTEMTRGLVEDEAFNAWVRGRTPAGRWGRVQDLVGPAVWLASDGSDYVNGQVVFIDGGMSVVV
ncbi:SDR family oxidoreductase [Sinomonas susongensis]|uniref:SDR family oxidoreductase n=1 Tax=Sinomonas susongensis TaxID=1324851 RepID=UPI0011088651|nr:SDR family oxidoreductase [Sinomonas susongensis]